MSLWIAGQLGDDLGPLIEGHHDAELADGVQVEELLHEVLQELQGATESGGFQILENGEYFTKRKGKKRCIKNLQGYS